MILIRSFSHGNEVSVFYDEIKNTFTKVGLSEKSKNFILADKKGIDWYTKNNKNLKSFVRDFWDLPNYTRLDLNKINGKISNYNSNILINKSILEKSINHYLKIWPKQTTVPSHGDLTLDNIIVQNNQIIFFDWEHFNPVGEIWGFDLVYLVLSAISLPNYNNDKIPKRELDIFCYFWKKLLNLGINKDLIYDPFNYFNRIFINSKFWSDIIDFSPKKMFPLVLNDGLKKQIVVGINNKVINV